MDEAQGAARCTLERLAMDVLHFHAARGAPRAITGCEWWVQVRTAGGQPTIRLHWDSDELYKVRTGEHLPPWLATVTYLSDCGAPTLVLPVAADAHGRAARAGSTAYASHRTACVGASRYSATRATATARLASAVGVADGAQEEGPAPPMGLKKGG